MKYNSLNVTTFAMLGGKICAAMQEVLNTGNAVRLKNRKDEPWLLVVLERHKERGYTFRFITPEGQEVGDIILKASVKHWSDAAHIIFWTMHGEAWELSEHPIVRLAREREERRVLKVARSRTENLSRVIKATHKVHFWARNEPSYGLYKRNWYGKKVLHLVNVETGKTSKVNPEVLPLIRYVEPLV